MGNRQSGYGGLRAAGERRFDWRDLGDPVDDGGPLLQGKMVVDGIRLTSTSARYLTGNAAEAASAQVSTQEINGGLLSFSSRVGSEATPMVLEMTASSTYQRRATMAEWSGCWQISGDSIESRLCVNESGQISGYRGACQLGGLVSLRPEGKSVVNVALQEQGCSEGASFTGIGAYGRNSGVIVEGARMLALKDASETRRSLVGLVKAN